MSHTPDGLSESERELIDAALAGVSLDFGSVPLGKTSWFNRDDVSEAERSRRTIRAEVLGDLLRGERWTVHWKGVQLSGAKVVGGLDLSDADLKFTVSLQECLLEDVRLDRATVRGFQLARCRVRRVMARGLTARFGLWMTGSTFDRGIDLSESHIGENLELEYSTLGCRPDLPAWEQIALSGEHLNVAGMIRLVGATITGAVHLPWADVGSRVVLTDARIAHPQRSGIYAVNAPGLRAQGEIALNGSTVIGGVNLKRARIGSSLELRLTTVAALVDPAGGTAPQALACDGVIVAGNVVLESCAIEGFVGFPSAEVGGSFICEVAKALGDGWLLHAARMRVSRQLLWNPRVPPVVVDLTYARLGSLDDERLEAWPSAGSVFLNGLTYDRIATVLDGKARMTWLRRQKVFTPQPYEQLAKVYREQGLEADARRIGRAKQQDRRRTLPWASQMWNALLGLALGHGYQPWRAVMLLALVYFACGLVFWHAQRRDAIVPSEPKPGVSVMHCTSSYPCFNPWAYAFDIAIPLVSLGQEKSWRPDASAPHGGLYRVTAWGGRVLGWAFATLAVVGLTGLVRKD